MSIHLNNKILNICLNICHSKNTSDINGFVTTIYHAMKFKCKLFFLLLITILFGLIFYKIQHVRTILENNPDIELGVEIKLPKITKIAAEKASRSGHFNASEFINTQKQRGSHLLRFESGKPSLLKSKVFQCKR